MPVTVDKSVVGKEYPPFPVAVERGKIKDFARAIGDANPFYLDDRVGAASAWGDVIAPPTFAVTFRDEGADETYLCRMKVVDIYEKTGKSGPMAFVVRDTAITDRTNTIVATMRSIMVIRL